MRLDEHPHDTTVQDLNASMRLNQSVLAEKEQEVANLQNEIDSLRRENDSLRDELSSAGIDSWRNMLAEKDQLIVQLRGEVAASGQDMELLAQQHDKLLADKDRDIQTAIQQACLSDIYYDV